MKVLNLLSSGGIGGIETLCKDIGKYSSDENTFCFIFNTGVMYDEMKAVGCNTVDISKESIVAKLKRLKELSKQYDVIIAHHGSLGMHCFFDYLMTVNHKPKYILVHHSCFEKNVYYSGSEIRKISRKLILKYAMEHADRIVYVSEAGKKSFIENFKVDESKTRVVYNGISDDLIEIGKTNTPSFNGELRILYIGRLSKVKGVHLLISAVAKLSENYRIKVKIVGDGEELKNLKSQTNTLSLGDVVSFEGATRDKEKYYRWANIFVYPSVWQEVFGISIVEAMAFGLPCVANNVGGIPEIIKDRKNGIISYSADIEGVKEALSIIIEIYQSFGINEMSESSKMTASMFTVKNTVDELARVCRS